MTSLFVPLHLRDITAETADTQTFIFDRPDDPRFAHYLPGQHLTLRVLVQGQEQRRAFALTSAASVDADLRITVKRLPGGQVSTWLHQHADTSLYVESMPPVGKFAIVPDPAHRHHYVLIGAGIGICPLFAMLREVLHTEPHSQVSLWYGNRTEADIIFRQALAQAQAQYPDRLHLVHVLSQPAPGWAGTAGHLDAATIYRLASDLFMHDTLRKQYYLCGPQGLMDSAFVALDRHGVHPADIFFSYYAAPVPTEQEVAAYYTPPAEPEPIPTVMPAFEKHQVQVLLDGDWTTITVEPGQSILAAATKADLGAPYSCQSGICTTCRAKLLEGEVVMDNDEGLSDEEREDRYILTCQAHPTSEGVKISYDE